MFNKLSLFLFFQNNNYFYKTVFFYLLVSSFISIHFLFIFFIPNVKDTEQFNLTTLKSYLWLLANKIYTWILLIHSNIEITSKYIYLFLNKLIFFKSFENILTLWNLLYRVFILNDFEKIFLDMKAMFYLFLRRNKNEKILSNI